MNNFSHLLTDLYDLFDLDDNIGTSTETGDLFSSGVVDKGKDKELSEIFSKASSTHGDNILAEALSHDTIEGAAMSEPERVLIKVLLLQQSVSSLKHIYYCNSNPLRLQLIALPNKQSRHYGKMTW